MREERGVVDACLQPLGGKRMADDAIVVREHRVRGVAHERMPERILALAREAR